MSAVRLTCNMSSHMINELRIVRGFNSVFIPYIRKAFIRLEVYSNCLPGKSN